ncbi:MAG: NAD(P)-dependent alcohol dehydrogenase [Euryarchaeota archaeon]|nr:NAD(P)-dependent alcohol dehydrogenase [Euryarchaeota archaeon]
MFKLASRHPSLGKAHRGGKAIRKSSVVVLLKKAISGYAAKALGQELEQFSYMPPKLKDYDVRVSVTHCGLCFSDIHAIDDYYGITTFPFVPGHEIVGHVSEVGSAVSGLKKGDRIGIGWQGRSCMQCEWCLKGDEHLCTDIDKMGVWTPYGGFSSSTTADSRFAYSLPASMPSEVAAVLLCAGIAVYSPLRSWAIERRRKIGIVGVGGLGHLAIQFAHALDYEVTALSSSPDKEGEALALGADHFLVARDKASLRQMKFSFDMLLYTGHGNNDFTSLLRTLKKNGKLLMVGFPPQPFAFEPVDLVVYQLSVAGSFLGNRTMMREMLAFARERGIKPKVELMSMSQVNEAIRKVKEGKARYRIVLVNEPARTRT